MKVPSPMPLMWKVTVGEAGADETVNGCHSQSTPSIASQQYCPARLPPRAESLPNSSRVTPSSRSWAAEKSWVGLGFK